MTSPVTTDQENGQADVECASWPSSDSRTAGALSGKTYSSCNGCLWLYTLWESCHYFCTFLNHFLFLFFKFGVVFSCFDFSFLTQRQCDLTWKYFAFVLLLLPQQPFEAYQTELYDEKSQIKSLRFLDRAQPVP